MNTWKLFFSKIITQMDFSKLILHQKLRSSVTVVLYIFLKIHTQSDFGALASDMGFQNGLFQSYISGEDNDWIPLDRKEVKKKFIAQKVKDKEVWKIFIIWSFVQQNLSHKYLLPERFDGQGPDTYSSSQMQKWMPTYIFPSILEVCAKRKEL